MKNAINEMFAMMLLLMVVAIVLQVIIGTLTFPLDQLLQAVYMDELYNLCKKCKYIRVDYSKMLDEDKQPLVEAVEYIIKQYQNMLDCTNNWYAMTRDITIVIKQLGYAYQLELVHYTLVIDVC